MFEKLDDKTRPSPPPQPQRRRGLLWTVLAVLILTNALVTATVFLLQPHRRGLDLVIADDFMRAIEAGNDELGGGLKATGYEQAFELLTPEQRAETEFGDFLLFFDETVSELGFIQSWHRVDRDFGKYGSRKLRFRVEYGGIGAVSAEIVYEFGVDRRGDCCWLSSYRIVSRTDEEH